MFNCRSYGRKHVVFGKVVQGMETLKKIEQVGTGDGKPALLVKIVDCGETSENKIIGAAGTEKGNEISHRFNAS